MKVKASDVTSPEYMRDQGIDPEHEVNIPLALCYLSGMRPHIPRPEHMPRVFRRVTK